MAVKLTNFVRLVINHHFQLRTSGDYTTAALIHYNPTQSDPTMNIVLSDVPSFTDDTLYLKGIQTYITKFFDNGGRNLHIISINDLTLASAQLETLPMEELVVGFVNDTSDGVTPATEEDFRAIALAWNTANQNEKIYQKIFVAELPYSNGVNDITGYATNGADIENYAIKYGANGIGAAVLAYYTALEINSTDSARDYSFTTENYSASSEDHFVFDDNAIVEAVMANNLNADTKLVGKVKVVGGNDTAGYDLTNQYMLLVLHQAVTKAVMQVITSKVKYNETGLALVYNAIVNELERFVSNGYLTTNKAWNYPDLYYNSYKIITNGTALVNGYKVTILPFESLTDEQRAAHQLPNIYILIADSYSIRKVVIEGEVF